MLLRHARLVAILAGVALAFIVTTGAASATSPPPVSAAPSAEDTALNTGLSGLGGVAGTLLTIWLWQRRRDDQLSGEIKRLEGAIEAHNAKSEARHEALTNLVTELRIKLARFDNTESPS